MSTAVQTVSPTLYELEQDLAVLFDTEEFVEEKDRAEYEAAVAKAYTATVQKRDRVAQFILHCDTQIAACDAEIKRLQARKKSFSGVVERMRNNVLGIIFALGKNARGKYQELQGKTSTLCAHKNPSGVDVLDADAIPARFKRISLTLPYDKWCLVHKLFSDDVLQSALTPEEAEQVKAAVVDATEKADVEVMNSLIKAAFAAEGDVPGARLDEERYRLAIK